MQLTTRILNVLVSLAVVLGVAHCRGADAPSAKQPAKPVPNPAHPTALRKLEGFLPPEKPYRSELITRVDNIHKVGYEKWVNTAWAAMLIHEGVIPPDHAPEVAESLLAVWRPTLSGSYYTSFTWAQGEAIKKYGQNVGGNVNLARTSPPARQTMPVRHKLLREICVIHDFQEALLNLAEKHTQTVMPGYTHIRHAQPTTFGHYLVSVHDPIQRSMRIVEQSYYLMNLNELGCGALAGTSWPIDRDLVSAYLGMEGLVENSNDAVSYSDGFLVVVAGLTNVVNVSSRLALDLNYWSTPEFGFMEFDYHGPSFMMPNKSSNQAHLEVTRVSAAQMLGYLTNTAAMGMRCPHADMVEMLHMQDGPIRALDEVDWCLRPMIEQLHGITVLEDKMLAGAREGYSSATELANQIVRDYGIDYRTAHKIVHDFVVESEARNIPASEARTDLLDAAAEEVLGKRVGMAEARLRELLDPVYFVKVTNSRGGVAPEEVARMIADRRSKLEEARARHLKRIETLENAQKRLVSDLGAICEASKKQ